MDCFLKLFAIVKDVKHFLYFALNFCHSFLIQTYVKPSDLTITFYGFSSSKTELKVIIWANLASKQDHWFLTYYTFLIFTNTLSPVCKVWNSKRSLIFNHSFIIFLIPWIHVFDNFVNIDLFYFYISKFIKTRKCVTYCSWLNLGVAKEHLSSQLSWVTVWLLVTFVFLVHL